MSPEEGVNSTLMLGSVVVLVAGFALEVVNQVHGIRQAARDERRRMKHLTRFNDELSSVLQVVIELLMSDQDKAASARFFAAALREARHLMSHDGVRICVYKLDEADEAQDGDVSGTEDEAVILASSKYLRLESFGGRSDRPRNEFTADTPHGAAVIETAEGHRAVSISNPYQTEIPVDRPANSVWQSTLLIPLKDGAESLGVLMLDTREPVEFTTEDISIGWTIAQVIALGMGALRRGGVDPSPELATARGRLQQLTEARIRFGVGGHTAGQTPAASAAEASVKEDKGEEGRSR
ncbi:GAF domain-containing protein [Clavibacter michiganensis]|uniref:GAF domain-containing protein n=1 Tax=Clavibacter michiganensis TaxID=28447 RepID=UPI00138E4296|nr:GAF domain-containing protein [Clavibacter michiganensis]